MLTQQVGSLHAAGTIHGDIQSDAILITQDGSLQLSGAAKCTDHVSSYDSLPSDLEGISLSTLPKRIDDAAALLKQAGKEINPRRVDIYQLGVLGCRLFTGRSLSAYLRSPKIKAQVPGPLQSLMDAALGFDPDRRICDCETLADALARINLEDDDLVANGALDCDSQHGASQVGIQFEKEPGHSDDTPLPGRTGADELPTPTFGIVADDEHAVSPQILPTSTEGLSLRTLGQYQIVSRLGRGGMGDVYRAYDESLDRHVAIKVLPPELARHETFVRRFKAEAAAVAKLRHPNVVQVYCTGEDAGLQFFVMEFVAGESLAQLLSHRKCLDAGRAISIAAQCLRGLEAAHAAGLVHRDVKPGNILLERSTGRVLLADFGLVKAQMCESATGVVVGTADYISPEQAQNQSVDGRADLYSLGVVLYQILSGQVPFQAESSTGKLVQHAFEDARPLHETAPLVSPQLSAIVAKLMAKDRRERYQTAAQALEDLESFQAGTLDRGEVGAVRKLARTEQSGGNLAAFKKHRIAPFFRSPRKDDAKLKLNAGRQPPRRRKAISIVLACLVPIVGFGFLIIPEGARRLRPSPGEEDMTPSVPRQDPGMRGSLATRINNTLGMKFALIEPGEFMMGSIDLEKNSKLEEHPRHKVRLMRPFYMGVHEVTRGQFREFYNATDQATRDDIDRKIGYGYNPATRGLRDFGREFTWEELGWDQSPNHPVVGISYHSAAAFCAWLSIKESKGYRLPTEAEWEYCCRANTTTRFYCGDGDQDLEGYENIFDSSTIGLFEPDHFVPWNDGFPFTAPVGSYKPNPFGLYDMLGNAREYCSDNYMSNYGRAVEQIDPVGPGLGSQKVVRGGAWNRPPGDCRSACRGPSVGLNFRIHDTGFRVVLQVGNEPLPPAEPVPAPLPRDPNRHAAQVVLMHGGSVQLQTIGADGKPSECNRLIHDPIDLPSGPFRLTIVNLAGRKNFSDKTVSALRGLTFLARLDLSGTSVSTGGVNCLADLKNLAELNLNQSQATDEILSQLRDLPKLTTLLLSNTFVTDDGLLTISHRPPLEFLDVSGTASRGDFIYGCNASRSLKALSLGDAKVINRNLRHVRRASNLTHLVISKMRLSSLGLQELLDTPNLITLDIRNALVAPEALEKLKEFKQLKALHIARANFSEEFVKSLQVALSERVILD